MSAPLVPTTSGRVRGAQRSDGTTVFWNIPYAATPAGAGRFAAPTPAPSWSGVRDATSPGPTAPAPVRGGFGDLDMRPILGPGWFPGPDYLGVNVWTPDPSAAGLPVLVFVHGGGFVAGSARAAVADGTGFARRGVVLVTLNYRLNAAGWLHLPDAPANRGLLDVLAALTWVRDNIAGFGGDPDNITLFGQSAGATIVGAAVATAPTGLFRRAISQSGSGLGAFSTAQAALVTRALADQLGVSPDLAGFADLPDERIIAALPAVAGLDVTATGETDPLLKLTSFGLVAGTDTLPGQPAHQVAAGHGADVDLLLGVNSDEANLYLVPTGTLDQITDSDLTAMAARAHRDPERLVRTYRARRPAASVGQLHAAIMTDGLFGAGTRALAEAHAAHPGSGTHLYEFAWRSGAFDGTLGTPHSADLPFVFNTTDIPALLGPHALLGPDEPPAELAERMQRTWVDFATTGDPGWPGYDTVHRPTMRIADTWERVDDPRPEERLVWT
ncbi:carboxylesterase/lipase family protein [Goodfellowiella coeruleoviolacea]|uniref:Carboxylic ester hydrolase n=1 Tax=Goodfellowiella coeruleoviolacea TaxID=334858 RepID=A0AAE3G8B0_9PSEU|nr:carboxylesterase family protein [Goodfellowiella coeruleoviolacea]MCP2163561.1 para-nitrobenzyl esterase [Goodfellowiella coeruleoviolacea]